jgi:hypothetical protein
MVKQFPNADFAKGKMVVDQACGLKLKRSKDIATKQPSHTWRLPEDSLIKLNIDGAYSPDGRAGCGMIVRNHLGEVLVAACRQVHNCWDATEAEIIAVEEGVLRLTVHRL